VCPPGKKKKKKKKKQKQKQEKKKKKKTHKHLIDYASSSSTSPASLHVLPNHAEARVNTWWTRTFAAFTLLGAAPVLLLR